MATEERDVGVSLVLSFYNNGPAVESAVAQSWRILKSLGTEYEILCIDDASSDGCAERLGSACRQDPAHLRLLVHERNIGRGATVARGIREARHNIVGYIDVDLEIPIHCVVPLIWAIQDDEADVAIGARVYELSNLNSWIRFYCSKAYRRLVRLAIGVPFDTETGIKFFRRDRILPILDQVRDNHWFWDTEVVTLSHLHGLRVAERKVLVCRKPSSPSSVKLVHDGVHQIRDLLALRKQLRHARRLGHSKADESPA